MTAATTEWQRYRLAWRLDSPLHIGYRIIGTIMRTRLWVPGRNIWAALTEVLAQASGGNYVYWQNMLKQALRFEAWFLGPNANTAWQPHYTPEHGLCYDTLSEHTLQWLALGANVSTAITHDVGIAAEGNLFEVEYIAPFWLHDYNNPHLVRGEAIWLVGHLWVRTSEQGQDITINGHSLKKSAHTLTIGGERAKGYGRLTDITIQPSTDISPQSGKDPVITRENGEPFPLLVTSTGQQNTHGQIEPIVGRSTNDAGYGQQIESAQFCWLPGSVCDGGCTVRLPPSSPGIGTLPSAPART